MLTRHTLNWEESKAVFNDCRALIKLKQCYRNVYQVVNTFEYFAKFKSCEWKIAYGYVHITKGLYARHCFILNKNDEVIDPTLVLTHPEEDKEYPDYLAFAIINAADWFDLIQKEHYQVSLDFTFTEEEAQAHEYAAEHKMFLIG